jgi:hypothetical protein
MSTITEKLSYLNGTKSAIKNAIKDKGGVLTENSTFRSYAAAILGIQTEVTSVTDSTVEHIVFPEECNIPAGSAYNMMFELDDCLIMTKNGSATEGTGVGTVTRIYRDRENEADDIKFDVIARTDEANFLGHNFTFTNMLKVRGGALFSSSSVNTGYFYDEVTHELTQVCTKRCVPSSTYYLKDDPDEKILMWSGNCFGLLMWNQTTRQFTDLTPEFTTQVFNIHTEFKGMHIFGANNYAYKCLIFDENDGSYSRTTNAARFYGFAVNPSSEDDTEIQDIQYIMPGTTTAYPSFMFVVDVRNGTRTVAEMLPLANFYSSNATTAATNVVCLKSTTGYLFYGIDVNCTGFVFYNKNARTLTHAYTAGSTWTISQDIGTGMVFSSITLSQDLVYFRYSNGGLVKLGTAALKNINTFVNDNYSKNYTYMFNSIDSTYATSDSGGVY